MKNESTNVNLSTLTRASERCTLSRKATSKSLSVPDTRMRESTQITCVIVFDRCHVFLVIFDTNRAAATYSHELMRVLLGGQRPQKGL